MDDARSEMDSRLQIPDSGLQIRGLIWNMEFEIWNLIERTASSGRERIPCAVESRFEAGAVHGQP